MMKLRVVWSIFCLTAKAESRTSLLSKSTQ